MKGGKQLTGSHRDLVKTFDGPKDDITSIATFPDGERIATSSTDKTIRIWRLENGREMKKWVTKSVSALVISRNGKQVVSAEGYDPRFEDIDKRVHWRLWVRDAETGRVITGSLDSHTNMAIALDISPDGSILASGSYDHDVILWNTTTWQKKGDPLSCGAYAYHVQFSPTGPLGVATNKDIQRWDLNRRERIARFKAPTLSFASTHDSARLLSASDRNDPFIRSWDTCTWKKAGRAWTGHDEEHINHIILDPTGTLLASASDDHTVRLWQLHTGTEVARYEHSDNILRIAFSVDGRFIFGSSQNNKISQWKVPENVLAVASSDPLVGEMKAEIASSRGKQNYTFQFPAHVEHRSPTRTHGAQNFFNQIRPSSNTKGKQKECRPKGEALEVVGVPLGQATYGDYVASEEDGIRPYSLFFCLSWFHKKAMKPDPTPQVYDVELMNDEQEKDPLDVPIPTTKVRFIKQEDIELTPVASQSQPEAGLSRPTESQEHPVAQSP